MPSKQVNDPLPPPSAHLRQQELQLQQYISAAMSAREHERDHRRLSPEPHLEIMRPVSPFQNKRQLAHEQAQVQAPLTTQTGRDQRTLNSHYQTYSSSQPYTHAKESRVQEASPARIPTNSYARASSGTHQTRSRSKQSAQKGDSRSARRNERDADISPALRMMAYDTSLTPPSSDQGHGRGTNAPPGTLAPPDRGDMNRSTSPEGTRRKNPGWRKPVPKYIPTPPSTPPTTVFEKLSSIQDKEEPVPPVPPPSASAPNTRTANSQPVTVKAHLDSHPRLMRSPPQRPARAATDPRIPAMFRDRTADLVTARAHIPTIQHPAQVHTHHRSTNVFSGSQNPLASSAPSQMSLSLRAKNPPVTQVQAPSAPQPPPQVHAAQGVQSPLSLATARSHSNSRPSDAKVEPLKGVLVHPQPKKVPSMAQLVAMVLPSRTPSPRPAQHPIEISGPLPLAPASEIRKDNMALSPASQSNVPSLSIEPPSPIADTEAMIATAIRRSLLQPEQIQLPPSGESSRRSSRSPSPETTPSRPASPSPARSRSRSPSPFPIPQYAPSPSSRPVHQNTSMTMSRRNTSAQSQLHEAYRPAERVGAAAEPVSHVRMTQTRAAAMESEERSTSVHTHHSTRPSRDQSTIAGQAMKAVGEQMNNQSVAASIQVHSPLSREAGRGATQSTPTIDATVRPSAMPIPERAHSPPLARHLVQTMGDTQQLVDISAAKLPGADSTLANSPSSEGYVQATVQAKHVMVTLGKEPSNPALTNGYVYASQESGKLNFQTTQLVAKGRSGAAPLQSQQLHGLSERAKQDDKPLSYKRPEPVPMSEHSQVSRESGLVTPPTTPPGTLAATMIAREERGQTNKEESFPGDYAPEKTIAPAARSRSPAAFQASAAPIPRAYVHREALIQDEQASQGEELRVKETRSTPRPTIPTFPLDSQSIPDATPSTALRATPTPALPADWKETISRVVRSNASPSASPRVHPQDEIDESSSILPFMQFQPQPEKKEEATGDSGHMITGAWVEKIEHPTTALELHIHEVEANWVTDPAQSPEKLPVDNEKEVKQQLLTSRSPRRIPPALELSSTTTPTAKRRAPHDLSSLTVASDLVLPEPSARSRSAPRRKAPQQYHVEIDRVEEKIDARLVILNEVQPAPSVPPEVVEPPVRQPVQYTSRSHPSGPRKKVKATQTRVDNDDDGDNDIQMQEDLPDKSESFQRANVPMPKESTTVPAESQSSAAYISPPQKYKSLNGSRKRLPLNGSESSLVQFTNMDAIRSRPSSPPVAVRSLSPSSQTRSLPKPSRHQHGQHKHLPIPEVSQQAYRPPTPPIPSHYKKKRSNDMLPPEPPTFMKPAVHVIYPDTSTSHGPSLSGDSVLNRSTLRSGSNTNRTQLGTGLGPSAQREDRTRPQSPALSDSSNDEDDFENETDFYPQVPPKARRPEVNNYGSSPSNDQVSDFAIQHATRGQVRYPSAPVGEARAHTLLLPPSSNSSKSRVAENGERTPSSNLRARRIQQPHATKAARSQSEKVFRNKNNAQPLARSRSTPLPSSRQQSRRGFWRTFGMWAKVFMAKFKTWATPSPSPSHLPGYYDDEY